MNLQFISFLGEKTCYKHVCCKRNKVGNERRRGGVDVVVKANVEQRLKRQIDKDFCREVILSHLCFKLEVVLSKNNKLQFSKRKGVSRGLGYVWILVQKGYVWINLFLSLCK
jgi:hypothetical protein